MTSPRLSKTYAKSDTVLADSGERNAPGRDLFYSLTAIWRAHSTNRIECEHNDSYSWGWISLPIAEVAHLASCILLAITLASCFPYMSAMQEVWSDDAIAKGQERDEWAVQRLHQDIVETANIRPTTTSTRS